ncbi:hypothetical protein C7450_114130 [Chelatococcus asaccharovorans]|uniref:Uncharacterized protein n=1 Tax=Chelatococcus asaccharovorans TaxID=28210 RepID=A0A2V3TXH7_9HYPH|nr:hypothetical protein C7450_114130 [Chelatococcus asaccharovorans]
MRADSRGNLDEDLPKDAPEDAGKHIYASIDT